MAHDKLNKRSIWYRAAAVLFALCAAGGWFVASADSGTVSADPVVVYAAGDLGGSVNEIKPVADLIKSDPNLDKVLLLGDICYPDGKPDCYPKYVDPNYGSIKSKVIAVPGNHDYHTANGAGYFGYYPDTIPRAFDINNNWVVITYNTEIDHGASSQQRSQIQTLLSQNAGKHIIVITHHPRYTAASSHGDDSISDAIYGDLDAAKADLFVAGHNHLYERYAPSHKGGVFTSDSGTDGIRSFTAGTGGNGLYSNKSHAGKMAFDSSHHGALKLELYNDHYNWSFKTTDGKTIDAGSSPTRTNGSTTTTSSSSTTSTSTSTSTTTSTTTTPGQCEKHSGTKFYSVDPGNKQYTNLLYGGCWNGGAAWLTNNYFTTPWETFHHTGAWNLRGPATVKNAAAVNYGDSFRVEDGGNGFVFDSDLGLYGHDDCFENDSNQSGIIKNSICTSFVIYSSQGGSVDGSNNVVVLDGNYLELMPTPTVYKGPDTSYNKYPAPGTGGFWKLDNKSPKILLRNNTFVASVIPNHQDLNPPATLAGCSGNTVIWKGKGTFPGLDAWKKACPDTKFK